MSAKKIKTLVSRPLPVTVFQHIVKISLAVYIVSLAVPFFSNTPLIVLSLAGLISVFFIADRKLFSSPITWFLLLFIFSFLISLIFSHNFKRTLTMSPSLLPALILFFLIVEFYDRQNFFLVFWCFGVASALASMVALYAAAVSARPAPSDWLFEAGLPYFIVPNDFILLAVFIPFFMAMIVQQRAFFIKSIAVIIIVLNLILFTVYRSRGAILLSVLAIGLSWVMITGSYKKIFLVLLTVTSAVVMVDFFTGFQLGYKLAAGYESWLTRLAPWSKAWDLFCASPLIGTGPRTFGQFYPHIPWVHNLFLETLAEQGLLGVAALSGLTVSMYRTLIDLLKKTDVSTILVISWVIIFLGGLIEFSFIRHFFVIVFFVVVSLTIGLTLTSADKGEEKYDEHNQ